RLHLQERGVDAFKLMADLRKSLAEDVKSVGAQTASLAAGLWRDAAVALGAYALRSTGGNQKWLPVAAAVYLAISWYLGRRAASRAVNAIEKNEDTFRRHIFLPLLHSGEYETLAGSGYAAATKEFRRYRRLVATVYFVAIGFMLYGSWEFISGA